MGGHLLCRGVTIVENRLDRFGLCLPVLHLSVSGLHLHFSTEGSELHLVKHLLSFLKAGSILHTTLHFLL